METVEQLLARAGQLQRRAEQARKIAEDIESLVIADPCSVKSEIEFRYMSERGLVSMPKPMLRAVLMNGIQKVRDGLAYDLSRLVDSSSSRGQSDQNVLDAASGKNGATQNAEVAPGDLQHDPIASPRSAGGDGAVSYDGPPVATHG